MLIIPYNICIQTVVFNSYFLYEYTADRHLYKFYKIISSKGNFKFDHLNTSMTLSESFQIN